MNSGSAFYTFDKFLQLVLIFIVLKDHELVSNLVLVLEFQVPLMVSHL